MTTYEPPAEAVEAAARAIDPAIYPHINHLIGDAWAASKGAATAALAAAGPIIAAEALREAAQDVRRCWTGTTNLRDQDDPERFYSFDAWLDARAEVERLRREVAAGIETERGSNATARRLLAEARQQVADLREGIFAAVTVLNREFYRRPAAWVERLAADLRALLAEFDADPRGEDQWWESLVEVACDKGHRIFIDDGDGGVYACPACAPPTVKPSVEDVARAILMVTQAADVDPDYAWNVQYPEVQDELLDQARAVLALFEKGEGRG